MIQLKSLRISRFRGIREGEIKDLADVNVLVGRNNSGKSTIAEAMSVICWLASGKRGRDPLGHDLRTVWQELRRFPPLESDSWYRQERTHPIELTAAIGQVTFSVVARERSEPKIRVNLLVGPEDAVIQFAGAATIFLPSYARNPVIEERIWPTLLQRRLDKELTRSLNKIFNIEIEQIQLLPDRNLQLLFQDFSLPDLQGDGTRATLRCLMMLSALRGTMFVIEEPESHQHPGSLERFALALCGQAQRQDVQLFISTHSIDCVRAFLRACQQAKPKVAVYNLKLTDGLLEAIRLDPETVETLHNTGVDVRFLELYR